VAKHRLSFFQRLSGLTTELDGYKLDDNAYFIYSYRPHKLNDVYRYEITLAQGKIVQISTFDFDDDFHPYTIKTEKIYHHILDIFRTRQKVTPLVDIDRNIGVNRNNIFVSYDAALEKYEKIVTETFYFFKDMEAASSFKNQADELNAHHEYLLKFL